MDRVGWSSAASSGSDVTDDALLRSWCDHLLDEWGLPTAGEDGVVQAALPIEHLAQVWELRWPRPRTVVRMAAGRPPGSVGVPEVTRAPGVNQLEAITAALAEELGGASGPASLFRAGTMPVAAPFDGTLRPLGPGDGPAVDALLAACTPEDRGEAEVALDHDVAVGAFTDSRLVAMATVLEWHGFRDVGVLTSPDARGRGAGRAAVARVVSALHDADDPRPVLYRHAAGNVASSRLAEGLGFPVLAGVCSVRTSGSPA